jgi:apolipoprotein N-acyltransferase
VKNNLIKYQFNYLSQLNWLGCLLLIIAGAATTLAFAPFFQVWILLLAIPFFATALRKLGANSKRIHHFIYGWCYGLGYFLSSTYWIANALLVDAAAYFWYIPFATFGLSSVLACYFGLMALLLRCKADSPILSYSFCFASSWLGCELLRAYAFSGFPWNLLGYAWGASDVTIQAASIGGVFTLSALTSLFAFAPLWINERKFLASGAAIACLFALIGFGTMRLNHNPTNFVEGVQLRLVQAAIPQQLKWDSAQKIANFREYLRLSAAKAVTPPTHIIWSESAMTTPFRKGDYVAKLLSEAAPKSGSILTGVIRVEGKGKDLRLYNSMQAINAEGEIDSVYDKRHLVPFGEYMPFRELLPFKKLTQGTVDFAVGGNQQTQQTKGAPPFHTIICYEAIFPHLSENVGAKWLLNITNDAWFGNSTGPRQHLQMSRMRAVEQGLPLVRAAGTGISAVIDPYGRILQSLDVGLKGVLDSPLPQPTATTPISANHSMQISIIFLLFFLLIGNMVIIMKIMKKHFVHLLMLLIVGACGDTTVREELGLVRVPPDEFRVVARAPLTVPKEFFLYPPEEAIERNEGQNGGNAVKKAIFGDNANDDYLSHYQNENAPATNVETAVENVGASELPSNAEASLLQKMNVKAQSTDIRKILREDNDETAAKEDNLLEQLKQPIQTSEPVVDPSKEQERLQKNKKTGKSVTEGKVPTVVEKKNLLDRLF